MTITERLPSIKQPLRMAHQRQRPLSPWLFDPSLAPWKLSRRPASLAGSCFPADKPGPVLATDVWSYVSLWLRRSGDDAALFYWSQAREFAKEALTAATTVAPLLHYYSFLNAAKALFASKSNDFHEYHGLSAVEIRRPSSFDDEEVSVKREGVFQELHRHFYGSDCPVQQVPVLRILGNVVSVHNAFVTTTARVPIFHRIREHRFVENAGELAFVAGIEVEEFEDMTTARKRALANRLLGSEFAIDQGVQNPLIIRSKESLGFANAESFRGSHEVLRQRIHVLYTPREVRYYLQEQRQASYLAWSQASSIFAAMFALGSLARYQPLHYHQYLRDKENWLLEEFVQTAPAQYLHQLAAEITGQTFRRPEAAIAPNG